MKTLAFYKTVAKGKRQTQCSKRFARDTEISEIVCLFREGTDDELGLTFFEADADSFADDVNPITYGARPLLSPFGGVQEVRGEDEEIRVQINDVIRRGKYLVVSALNDNVSYSRTMRVFVS